MFWPCETRTSICRNLATISSGLYRFLAIAVLLDVTDIPQVGPLQWGRITALLPKSRCRRRSLRHHDVWYQAHQLFRVGSHLVDITEAPAEVDHDIAIL